jgi:hypothetical protein
LFNEYSLGTQDIMNTSVNSTKALVMTTLNLSEDRRSGGMKRRAETLSTHRKAKRLRREDLQEKVPFISLPNELLISIIQQTTFVHLRGLLGSCKKFQTLVLTHANTIILNKVNDNTCTNLKTSLEKMTQLSRTNLKVFSLWSSPSNLHPHGLFNDQNLFLLSLFSKLTKLVLGKGQISHLSEVGILHLTTLQTLSHLELDCGALNTSAFVPVLPSLTNLTYLELKQLRTDTQNKPFLSSLAMTSLQHLGIWMTQGKIAESSFADLVKNKGLRKLSLGNCHSDIVDSFKHISPLTELRFLCIFSDSISNQQVARLTTLTNLNDLRLSGCPEMNDEVSVELIKLKKITHLAVSIAPRITKIFLERISGLELKSLYLAKCEGIRSQDLVALHSIPTLIELSLERLNQLGNEALQNIAKHPTLMRLYLFSLPKIDDEGIKFLQNMIHLKTLFIKNCTKTTKLGVDFLRTNHPNFYLNHRN